MSGAGPATAARPGCHYRFSDRIRKGRRALQAARQRSVPLRQLIPNIVTLIGLCVGLTSIRMAIEGRFENALIAIAGAAVLDGIDGRMARLLEGVLAFRRRAGFAVGFRLFRRCARYRSVLVGIFRRASSLGWIVVLIFAVAAALRLARFNVALDDPGKPIWESAFFVGVPVPAGAILVLLPLYMEGLGLPKSWMFLPIAQRLRARDRLPDGQPGPHIFRQADRAADRARLRCAGHRLRAC